MKSEGAAEIEFKGLITFNPLADRPRYQKSTDVRHCREFCPQSTDELHDSSRHLFSHPHSVVLGFQLLAEAFTGLRTKEVLLWGEETFGTMTENGTDINVWRLKNQHHNNPYCTNHEGMKALLKAHAAWNAANYPDRPEFFPSHYGGTVSKGALSHALRRLHKKGPLKRKLTSHGAGRAFYVLVRRSQGTKDEIIADEIGHSSNGACIKSTYGGVPESWRNGGGPNMKWLPKGSHCARFLSSHPSSWASPTMIPSGPRTKQSRYTS